MNKNVDQPKEPDIINVTCIIGGNVTNLGDNIVYINETGLLVFDYPLNTSDQRILSMKVYVNGTLVPQEYLEIVNEDPPYIVVKEDFLNKRYLSPNETLSAYIEYKVMINMSFRKMIAKQINESLAEGWSNIIIQDKEEIGETRLWNYTNPLVRLLIKYLNSNEEYNSTPLDYVLGAIEWFKRNVKYSPRIPPRQPWEVVAFKEGDCDDMSNLLITILRSRGIPAFLETGIIYLSREFIINGSSVNGYYKYVFIGGGAHGWIVAYIPPWGYVRIDTTFGFTEPLTYIKYAAYYNFPTIVFGHIKDSDYPVETVEFIETIREKELEYTLIVEVKT